MNTQQHSVPPDPPTDVQTVTDSSPGPILAVVGCTATGKSDLALDLAELLGGEIINADASQLYKGMNIGTAKTPVEDRRGIPHHMLDVLDIHDEATVASYQAGATTAVDAVWERGRVPILVGGTGLYVRAVVDRLDIPPTDPAVRHKWEELGQQHGVEWLRARLAEVDPVAVSNIDAHNGRRLIRALEVCELTGRPFSATLPTYGQDPSVCHLGLKMPTPMLNERIDRRCEAMWAHGLLAEVHGLERQGLATTRTASRAIGYSQALDQLAGRCTQDEAIASTAVATHRLGRRQRSWFGRDPRITWWDTTEPGWRQHAMDWAERWWRSRR